MLVEPTCQASFQAAEIGTDLEGKSASSSQSFSTAPWTTIIISVRCLGMGQVHDDVGQGGLLLS